ncbi:PTS sugar transporter subunit IIA [Granulicatella sp. zg-ZJ]|uniref:PTS sugar transporter subunit IIA n=1 Tax=Granulicatella sp. zg-ZJ TaxID=2678504 RepID=UPI0013D37EC6|nr:PTS sugar transporter subunit IIA [Granulicatella sp. zg-ZJ]MBS4750940.1 PTS sugar transporter subunit IIA [Carnobacteriaceae bacterium zg-ZUI78]NEW62163.1 PTS sugar transporter subunit IIA [Granulicatella sp. zg-ZJ]
MLKDVLRETHIQLDVEADNFEDAILLSVAPLLKNGFVSQEYVDNIIRIYKETGPYIVITKHVALPHAPSQCGALKLGMGLTRLKTPVVSGNQANDPVKYLFSLSAPDSNSHLEVLAELVSYLSNDTFLSQVELAKEPKDIMALFLNNN